MTMDEDQRGGVDEPGEGYEWEEEPDFTSVSEEELRVLLKELVDEERSISYCRHGIQGRIDLIRAELVRRGGASLSPQELPRILMDGESPSGEGF